MIKIQTKVLWKEATKNSHAPHQENILAKLLPKFSGSKCEADLSMSVGSVEDELFNWRICFQALNPLLWGRTLRGHHQIPGWLPLPTTKNDIHNRDVPPNSTRPLSLPQQRGLHLHSAPAGRGPWILRRNIWERESILTIEAFLISATSMLVDPNV